MLFNWKHIHPYKNLKYLSVCVCLRTRYRRHCWTQWYEIIYRGSHGMLNWKSLNPIFKFLIILFLFYFMLFFFIQYFHTILKFESIMVMWFRIFFLNQKILNTCEFVFTSQHAEQNGRNNWMKKNTYFSSHWWREILTSFQWRNKTKWKNLSNRKWRIFFKKITYFLCLEIIMCTV